MVSTNSVLLVLFVLLAVTWIVRTMTARANRIDGTRARELVRAGARLVDVRTPQEYSGQHLSGALNLPVSDLGPRLGELEPKSQPIVVYCASGWRSAGAARMLKQAGFQSVYDLGPMSAW
jgi:phage shock protein E